MMMIRMKKMEINGVLSTIDKSETIEEQDKISKFRSYTSQIYATCATNIVKFTVGVCIGFTSILVAEFHKDNAEIRMSINDLGWFSSYGFTPPVGCLFLGILAHRFGSRLTMLISTISFVISFLVFYFATNSTILMATQVLAGLFLNISIGPGMTYVVEIAQPQLRSVLVASTTLSSMFAAFLVVVLSNFLYWRTIALVMLVFPTTAFIAVCTIPESPHWLASKNKFDKAEAALRWLRGWTSPQKVALEFNKLKETHMQSPRELSVECPKRKSNRISSRLSFLKDRSFYVPLSLTCLLYTLHACTGYHELVIYSIVIFSQINAPIDPHVAASIFDAMRIVGALLCILTIGYIGKKKLVYITLTAAGLTNITSSSALWLKEYQIYPEACQWIAAISMMLTTFLTSAGIDKVVHILNVEIFPSRYRNIGSGIGLFTNAILQSITTKIFLSFQKAVALHGVFIVFGITCIVNCIMFHFMFPETEGKTLQEIEEHYQGIKKLEKKDKNFQMSTETSSASIL